jgi:hypothetical protein
MSISFAVVVAAIDLGGMTFTENFTISIFNDPSDDPEEVLSLSDARFEFYPNPAGDQIQESDFHSDATNSIVAIDGRAMSSGELQQIQDVSKLPPGLYFLKVTLDGKQ